MKAKAVQITIAVIVGGLCLFFFAKGMDWQAVWGNIRQAKMVWIIGATFLTFAAMWVRSIRWQAFLGEPKVSYWRLFLILNVGFMGNGVLPARMGELIRPAVASRMTPHGFTKTLATIVVERVFDLLGILICLSFVLFFLKFPELPNLQDGSAGDDPRVWIQELATLGFFALIVLISAVGVLTFAPDFSLKIAAICFKPLPEGISSKLLKMVEAFEEGAAAFRKLSSFLYCLGLTLVIWFIITFSELMVLWAFDVNHVNFLGAMFVMAALCFAVMFPQLPGYIGVFQIALSMVLVKTFFVDKPTSDAISMVMWFTQIPPVIVAGFVSLLLLGVSFSEIKNAPQQPELQEIENT